MNSRFFTINPAPSLSRLVALALILGGGLTFTRPAVADHVLPADGWADTVDATVEFHPWLGVPDWETSQAWGTVIGEHKTIGTTVVDVEAGLVSGRFFSWSLEDESTTVWGTYSGMFITFPNSPMVFIFATIEWADGTGRLQGVSGRATLRSVEPDAVVGDAHYEYHGFFRLP